METKFGCWYKGSFIVPKEWLGNRYLKEMVDNGGILAQYSGVNDKKGKGMYAGHIARYSNSQESGIAKIEYWRGGFVAIWIEQKTTKPSILTPMFYLACSEEWEIIGNIYEHSHLLSGSNAV